MADGATRKVLAIAAREFRHTVLTKGFILGAIAVPALMFVAFLAVGWLAKSTMAPISGTLAVLDRSGRAEPFVRDELSSQRLSRLLPYDGGKETPAMLPGGEDAMAQAAALAPKIDLSLEFSTDPADEEALRARVRDGALLGLAIVPPAAVEPPPASRDARVTLIVPSNSPPRLTTAFERGLERSVVKARVQASGNDWATLDAIMHPPSTDVRRLGADGTEAAESVVAKTLLPMGFMMLLWVCTFTSGQYLLTSTIEEKSSKVMEVVLSAVSPMQLLGGKILGFAAVSAVMLGMYGGLGIAGLQAASMGDLVSPGLLVLLGVYFVMAYAFVAIMMASVGSAVNDLREAQSLVTPAMLVLMVPLILWLPISEQPNGMLAVVMSFVPPATPFVMALRVAASSEPIAAWQVAASIVWGFACVAAFLWAGAKVFRVGVLMQGKPPTPRELLRWIRMA